MEVADGTSETNLIMLDNLGQVLLGATTTSLFELSDSDSWNSPNGLTKMVDTTIEVQKNLPESVGGGNESSQQSIESCVIEKQSSNLKATAAAATSTTNSIAELLSIVTPPSPKASTDSNMTDIS
ncbi:hypothetical protein LINGRAHAP2_LOCUS30259 [Linum grandiflorum]